MSITPVKRLLILAAIALSIVSRVDAWSADGDTLAFQIGVEGGGGYVAQISKQHLATSGVTRSGIGGLFRLRWGSSRRVGLALETGFWPVSSSRYSIAVSGFGTSEVDARLNAIPILLLFFIQRYGVQVQAGTGYYRLLSTVNVDGEVSESAEWDFGYAVGVGYMMPIGDACAVGAGIDWRIIGEQQRSLLSASVRVVYRLVRW